MYEKEKREKEELERKEPEVIEKVEEVEVIPEKIKRELDELRGLKENRDELKEYQGDINNYQKKKRELEKDIDEKSEYIRELEDRHNLIAQKAKIVQGVCGPIRKFKEKKADIEMLLKKDIELDPEDLNIIGLNADVLNEIAEEMYEYISTQKSNYEYKGDVINV
jgi:chromosome segregation ATPase